MEITKEQAIRRYHEWMNSLSRFDLPDWEDLPQLDLYMDQVIILLTRYLSLMNRGEDEKSITASIINNYVRMRIMPPPVKKKYSRCHIAYLVVICTLKRSLNISSIQRLLPQERTEAAVHEMYMAFVRQYRAVVALLRRIPADGGPMPPDANGLLWNVDGDLAITTAIFTALTKSLTEFLLWPEAEV
ncbi:MAG: DUF1836 domain-containing protein [Oscillospiraceae bacterium]|nr:DUF1836 domain-containing protein [Oscillospiraceae bacterium]